MAHKDVRRCHKVEMDILPSVRWLLFRQHSKVFGFVYLRECSYAGGCLLWTCAWRGSAHPGNWVNACQGLDSVHYAVDNSRAYGATMFVYCCAVITVGLCLFPLPAFLNLSYKQLWFFWFKRKVEKQKDQRYSVTQISTETCFYTASENHYAVMEYTEYSWMWTDLIQKHLLTAGPCRVTIALLSTENGEAQSRTVVHKWE